MKSDNWKKNYEMHEKISNVESELEEHYNKRNYIVERKAINNIQSNPKAFYKYAKRFNKDISGISDLLDGDTLVSDNEKKANLLQTQYESVWS